MPTSFGLRKATRTDTLCECPDDPACSQTPAKSLGHVRTLLGHGNREISRSTGRAMARRSASGRRRVDLGALRELPGSHIRQHALAQGRDGGRRDSGDGRHGSVVLNEVVEANKSARRGGLERSDLVPWPGAEFAMADRHSSCGIFHSAHSVVLGVE